MNLPSETSTQVTYAAIMAAAILTGFVVYWRTQPRWELTWRETLAVGLGAFCGGMLGAKLPFVLADWPGFLSGTAWLDDGKTIMSGFVGGYLGVQVVEWALEIHAPQCDRLAVPLAAAVGVGRWACLVGGCCYGTVTSLPWGIDFGDGQLRHPTQIYESAFHLTAAVVLLQLQRRGVLRGQLVKLYFVSYFLYRFGTEFIRPEPALWLGLTGYQWGSLVLVPFFAFFCCPTCRPSWVTWWRRGSTSKRIRDRRGGFPVATRTLCPTCLEPVAGSTFEREGRIYLERDCPRHGSTVALVSSNRRHYFLRDESPHPPLAPGDCCGGAPNHRSCVALLELTDACNLRCPVCYAGSPGGVHRPFTNLCADLEAFLDARGPLDVLQLSGGEPLLHPQLLDIIDHCKTLPIDYVMINTNGLELLRREGLAAELARRRPRLELYLQYDGLDRLASQTLRGEDLSSAKRAVLDQIAAHDLPATLVCTVAHRVNEGQVGEVLRLGLRTPQIRGITFQPATWAGRYAATRNPLERITLADVVDLIVRQSDGRFREEDFQPLPCSHPNCCSFAHAVRRSNAGLVLLNRHFNYEDHLDKLSDRMNWNLTDARECCRAAGRPEDFFRIVIKPFMDAWTYDQDRVDECCVHIIRPGGTAVSFCQFNVLERARVNGESQGPTEQSEHVQPVSF